MNRLPSAWVRVGWIDKRGEIALRPEQDRTAGLESLVGVTQGGGWIDIAGGVGEPLGTGCGKAGDMPGPIEDPLVRWRVEKDTRKVYGVAGQGPSSTSGEDEVCARGKLLLSAKTRFDRGGDHNGLWTR